MPYAIELNKITKTFAERSWRAFLSQKMLRNVEALKGITLSVDQGEIFGILGPNGAGKTTLIKILATLIVPDSGSGNICGYDLWYQSSHIRRLIGLVNTSERSFYWRLTGRQNLNFFSALYNCHGLQRGGRIEELLTLVGLSEHADIPFMKYSDGQKQRLAIARALLSEPEVLLMDEPTKSLDPIATSDLIHLTLHELSRKQRKTIIWCTHNLKEAEEVCSRLAIIHKGKIVASGTLEHMRTLIKKESFCQLIIGDCSMEKLKTIGISFSHMFRNNGCLELDVRIKEEEIPALIKQLVENNIQVHTCKSKTIELEEIFEKMVQ